MIRRLKLLIALAGLCAACTLTKTSSDSGATPGQAFGHCSTQALAKASTAILGDVTSSLAAADYDNALVQLATTYGAAEVGCAVDLVIAQFTTKASRSNDAQVGVVLAHAQAFRGEHP